MRGMPERLEIQTKQDIELKKQLERIDWNLDYGTVELQIRAGHVTMIAIKRTVRLD